MLETQEYKNTMYQIGWIDLSYLSVHCKENDRDLLGWIECHFSHLQNFPTQNIRVFR